MNYLAIDTSGFHLTVIAKGDRGEYTYYNEDCSLRHSVELMPAIDKALAGANLKKEEVDVFCCCLGPGSFTGIRIGVATAKAFGYALKKKVLGVTSFDCIAYNRITENVMALVDARHGHVYAAGYKAGTVSVEPSFVSVESLNGYSSEYTFAASSEIEGVRTEKISLAEGFRAAVESKLSQASDDVEVLYPLYIRKSQAEEGR
ncbi:MAG: tRNA (adenosine(37)-N6)-threonylcarbamoyltransferase complex dimerization subunit type 1 TsaB [Clostridia bacterium]|nr:tRNA (adenosine(37)-N6)-threonylcarbamoyltransferase complex dimerization subunit type 1 TsaB [Clostridia bacterium]